jgi:signal transduction histidine kinase
MDLLPDVPSPLKPRSDRQLRLRCSGNGLGVGPEVVEAKYQAGHWGIIGMRERTRALGLQMVKAS